MRSNRHRFAALITGCMINAILLTGVQVQAQTIVSPSTLANTEGDSNNGFPFNLQNFSLTGQRYQQVYNASEFSSIVVPSFITQIAFRPDAGSGGAFSTTLSNVQINLAVSNFASDALSATYANNVGANNTVVKSGALTLSSAFTGPANGPKNFDIIINLTTPFLYTPGTNLLLDVRNFAGGLTTQFDADLNSTGSRVFNTDNNVNAASGTPDSSALVTRFTFSNAAVPEPGSVALLAGLGVTGSLFAIRRLRRRKK